MKTIIVASTNPVKIQAARDGFRRLFPNENFEARGVFVPSGVPAQPMSSAETLQGALNRAWNARQQDSAADFWVGIEGGCEDDGAALHAFAWVVVLGGERIGKGQTATFVLPEEVAQLVRQGVELGEADDRVFGRSNSKQQNGAVGLLTGDVIDRLAYYEHAVILALVPFKNPHLTFPR
ncbi:MAG: inosine/xanthosine triphosphatase [Chloroflexi bacterium]|nr:inosine/xanthosine triphosphatase [Chloroflexota bacterium]